MKKQWNSANVFLDYLNTTYAKLHKAYEEAFWISYMGDHSYNGKKDAALTARDAFRTNEHLKEQAEAFHATVQGKTKERLRYWIFFFSLYQVPTHAKPLKDKIAKLETVIETKRAKRKEGYIDPVTKKFVKASLTKMSSLIRSHDSEAVRKACFEAIQELSYTVLPEYVKLVQLRNQYATLLGYEDFYAYKLSIEEGMTKNQLFTLFDTIYEKTKYSFADIRALEKKEKPGLRKPWNFSYLFSGSFTKEEEPYFPFEEALMRWGTSFAALGITFRGGKLVLDLLDRDGKYNNGFCHWPELVQYKNGKHIPGRSQFTCNVALGTLGQSTQGMVTLFHEGGHAAHLLNSTMQDVCVNHEYAPLSTAWAETQSQFLDTVFTSIEWKSRYAKTPDGKPYPFDLYERQLRVLHILRPRAPMHMLAVTGFEKRVYEDTNLTVEKVVTYARRMSQKYSDLTIPTNNLLETPHIYSWESACSYQGYLLAELALSQWREYFYKKYGYIVDNPRVGKEMANVWALGGSKTFNEFVVLATGKKLSAADYLSTITRSIPAALKKAKERISILEKKPRYKKPINMDVSIRMVHGKQQIANSSKGYEAMAQKYAAWLKTQYPTTL